MRQKRGLLRWAVECCKAVAVRVGLATPPRDAVVIATPKADLYDVWEKPYKSMNDSEKTKCQQKRAKCLAPEGGKERLSCWSGIHFLEPVFVVPVNGTASAEIHLASYWVMKFEKQFTKGQYYNITPHQGGVIFDVEGLGEGLQHECNDGDRHIVKGFAEKHHHNFYSDEKKGTELAKRFSEDGVGKSFLLIHMDRSDLLHTLYRLSKSKLIADEFVSVVEKAIQLEY